jgi:hypothetical protein
MPIVALIKIVPARLFKKVALKSRIEACPGPKLKKSHPAGDKGDSGFST